MISETAISSNGENFMRTDYNGTSFTIDSDGFYNASKMCSDNKLKFSDIYVCDYWKKFIEVVKKHYGLTEEQLIKTRSQYSGYSNQTRGTYIHKKLVNHLCMHVNYEYALKVSDIMDAIDEELHIRNITLEQKIKELLEENKKLKEEGTKLLERAVPVDTNHYKIAVVSLDHLGYIDELKISYDQTAFNSISFDQKHITIRNDEFELFALFEECPAGANLRKYFHGMLYSREVPTKTGKERRYFNVIKKEDFIAQVNKLISESNAKAELFDPDNHKIIKYREIQKFD